MRSYEEARAIARKYGHEFSVRHTPLTKDPQQMEADRKFLDAWVRTVEAKQMAPEEREKLIPGVKSPAVFMGPKHTFVDPKRGLTFEATMPRGMYEIEPLIAAALKFIGRKKKPDFSKFNWEPFQVNGPFVVLQTIYGENRSVPVGNLDGSISIIPSDGGVYAPGMIVDRSWKLIGTVTGEQYLKLLPAIHYIINHGYPMYTILAWDESLAEDFDKAEKVIENFRAMLRLLPQVTVEGAAPCLVRMVGFTTTNQGGVKWQIDEPYCHGRNNLTYDGKGWLLRLAIDGKPLSGRVIVQETGEFIVSEWCFREIPYNYGRTGNMDGPDMYSGEFNKHTLLSWCGGPLLDKFGGKKYKMQRIGGEKAMQHLGMLKEMRDNFKDLVARDWVELARAGKLELPCGFLYGDYLFLVEEFKDTPPNYYRAAFTYKWVGYLSNGHIVKNKAWSTVDMRYYPKGIHVPASLTALIFGLPYKPLAKESLPQEAAPEAPKDVAVVPEVQGQVDVQLDVGNVAGVVLPPAEVLELPPEVAYEEPAKEDA